MRTEEQHIVHIAHAIYLFVRRMKMKQKRQNTHTPHKPAKFTNEIVHTQRQLSVNCPTPQAIVNCTIERLAHNNDDDDDDAGCGEKKLHKHMKYI